VRSLPDGVGQVLDEYLKGKKNHQLDSDDHTETPDAVTSGLPIMNEPVPTKMGDLCPECGEATMVNEEGCRKCYTCGYSEC
jgi:ribonucleoside-diphosphate reductase alpha chain